jgi:hypothetical protein
MKKSAMASFDILACHLGPKRCTFRTPAYKERPEKKKLA